MGSSGARAASFVVDDAGEASDADGGDGLCATATATCTLRAALEQANALGGGHTITLPAGTYVQSATLPTVAANVTIAGAGAPTTIVQSSSSGHPRLFLVGAGALALSDLTLTGASIGPGSAIYGIGGDVTLVRCAITGNAGGAVYGDVLSTVTPAPVLVVSATTFAGNTAGAALTASNYDLVADGCAFDDNHQTGGGLGGAVRLTGSGASRSHTITASTFTSNTAALGGALAIGNPGGTPVTIAGCTFAGNVANGGGGGAVYNVTTGVAVTDSSFVGNQAVGNGGGILSPQVPFTCVGCTFAGNGATSTGGGVCASGITVLNGTFSGNSASSGGGIYVDDPFLANALHAGNLTLTGNTASGAGGGISGGGPNVVVKNSIVAANAASSGPDCSGTITSQGYNLLGDGTGCGLVAAPGDRVGTSGAPLAAGLGALGDHGGPTQTIPLLPGSPAIDGGNPAGCTDFASPVPLVLATDQRGIARPADGDGDGAAVCDAGAFEAPAGPPGSSTTTTSSTAVADATTTSTTLALPVCRGGVALANAALIVRRVAGPAGDESLRLTGSLAFPAGAPSFFRPRDTGAQVLIEDLGRGGAPMLELSHRTSAIPAGAGCEARDGWTRMRYTNASGRIDPPACTPGSANGLRTLRFKDRRRKGRGIAFALTTKRSNLGLPVGPFRATLVFGATTVASAVGECGAHAFAAADCARHGTTVRCR